VTKRPTADHLSDRELANMTSQLDQLHRDQSLPALQEAVNEWAETLKEAGHTMSGRRANRRTFLLGAAGLGVGGVLVAACGSSSHRSATGTAAPMASMPSASTAVVSDDLRVVAVAASIEYTGVFGYNEALKAAAAAKFGSVPPAVATFAKTAMAHHQDHAQAWNSLRIAGGKPPVTTPDPVVTSIFDQKLSQVTDVLALAELALFTENVAAQTYQYDIGVFSSPQAVAVAATIQPVEMQHAAILYYTLGRYPGIQGTPDGNYSVGAPLAFNPTTLTRPVSDYPGT
jgi:hypothetical protein